MPRRLAILFCTLAAAFCLVQPATAAGRQCPAARRGPYLVHDLLKVPPLEGAKLLPKEGGYVLDEKLAGKAAWPREPAPGASPGSAPEEKPAVVEVEEEMPAVRFRTETPVTPYVGAGIKDPNEEEAPGTEAPIPGREESPTPYVGAGIGCELGGTARLNLGYRYSTGEIPEFGPLSLGETSPTSDESHDFSLRFRLEF